MDKCGPPRMVQRRIRESKTELAASSRVRCGRNDRAVRVPAQGVACARSTGELLTPWRQAPLVLGAHQVFSSRSESKPSPPQRDPLAARKINELVLSQDSAKPVQGRARCAKTCDRLASPDCAVRGGEQHEKLDGGPPRWRLRRGPPVSRIKRGFHFPQRRPL